MPEAQRTSARQNTIPNHTMAGKNRRRPTGAMGRRRGHITMTSIGRIMAIITGVIITATTTGDGDVERPGGRARSALYFVRS